MILGDALQRFADEAHAARQQVFLASKIVEDFARPGIGGQGVDREIAPGGVFLPIVGERDGRAPAVGGNVPPQARDLERVPAADRGDRAVSESRRDRLDLGRFEPLDDRFG